MKYTQRLDYARLAEVLHERELVDSASLGELLQASSDGGAPFAEALVTAKLIGDWDLSRIVCEIFSLPFLPLDVAVPDPEVSSGVDTEFLVQNGLVPVSRFGQVMTVSLPALVPADVLGLMSVMTDMVILPTVGTVNTNRRWLEENLSESPLAALPVTASGGKSDSDWRNLFDEGDAAVQNSLDDEVDLDDENLEAAIEVIAEPTSLIVDEIEEDIDYGDFEVEVADLEDFEIEDGGLEDAPASASKSKPPASGGPDLPPMPDFG